jgi:hypothetical protein
MELQRADTRLRTFTFVAVAAATAAGIPALVYFQGWLAGVSQLSSPEAQRRILSVFAWLAGVSAVTVFALGAYLWHFGSRVRAAGRFPLPGSRVIRDTVVLRDAAAVRRGRIVQATGVVLIVCALGLLATSFLLYFTLAPHAA